jgi:hypothetical protein
LVAVCLQFPVIFVAFFTSVTTEMTGGTLFYGVIHAVVTGFLRNDQIGGVALVTTEALFTIAASQAFGTPFTGLTVPTTESW